MLATPIKTESLGPDKQDCKLFIDSFPQYIPNYHNEEEELNKDEFHLYGGTYSPGSMKTIKQPFRNNDCVAVIEDWEELGLRWRSGSITEFGTDYFSIKIEDDTDDCLTIDNENGFYLNKLKQSFMDCILQYI